MNELILHGACELHRGSGRAAARTFRRAIVLCFCCILACVSAAFSASSLVAAADAPAAQVPKPPDLLTKPDPLGRSTPYGTVFGFLRAAEKDDYTLASNFLDTKQPATKNEALVRNLAIVLNRGLKVGLEALSKAPDGQLDDGLSVYAEKVGTVVYGNESLDIVLRRTTRPDTPPIWLFAPETLLRVADAAEQLDLVWGEAIWPESVRQIQVLSLPLYRLLNLFVLLPLLMVLGWFIAYWLLRLLKPVALRLLPEHAELVVNQLRWITFLFVFAILLRTYSPQAVTVGGRIYVATAANVFFIVATSWLLVRITKFAARLKTRRLQDAGMPSSIAAVELSSWVIVCGCVITALFLILRSLGFEITAAIAGLGVGGIAIAFAAQKTLENLFGTATIMADKPIRVGDQCQAGSTEGRVESIGLRSTRIRTLDRALVTIPNGQLAAMTIGNVSDRDKFLFRHTIRLGYESTARQLRAVLAAIKQMMLDHPQLETSTVRTRLVRFADYSVDLEVFAYALTRDFPLFLEVQEDLLLRIMDIIEASGTSVALPYQSDSGSREAPRSPQEPAKAHRSSS